MRGIFPIACVMFCINLAVPKTFSQDTLFTTSSYYAGRGPIDVICADFDGDEDFDLAVINSVVTYNDKSIDVLWNEGDGTFAALDTLQDRYPMNCPHSACAADFDNDGDIDLAVADRNYCYYASSGKIKILENDGTGNFALNGSIAVEGVLAEVRSADLNNDEYTDLVVALQFQDSVAVLINNMDGSFGLAGSYPLGDKPYRLCGADFDGDGYTDLAVSNIGSHNVSILLNQGDGSFVAHGTCGVGNEPHGICTADFDLDGDFDVAVTNKGSNDLSILSNLGDGMFSPSVNYPAGNMPIDVIATDIDGDGYPDLAVANWGAGVAGGPADSVSILINNGDGSFAPADNYSAGDTPWSICSADLDGDCDNDLAVANYHRPSPEVHPSVSILKNQTGIGCTVFLPLDIKPGSCPNPLNVKAPKVDMWVQHDDNYAAAKAGPDGHKKPKAKLPVAILGTADFDITSIDPATVALEGVPALRWNIEDVSTPVGEDAEECECNEIGVDGFDDLTLKFYRSLIVEALGEVYDGDVVALTITGELSDGTAFEGTDCVVIRGNSQPAEEFSPPEEELPIAVLLGNFPNPFNPTTEISFSLPNASDVKLEVYNVMGQRVTTLADRFMEAGEHTVQWDAGSFSSGVYFYRLEAGEFVETKKMVLLK